MKLCIESLVTPLNIRLHFWHNLTEDSNGCYQWGGTVGNHGYGVLNTRQLKDFTAHRFAYVLAYGDPGSLHVLHRCDVRTCCNPDHLFLGTIADNNKDMTRKGRLNVFAAHAAASAKYAAQTHCKRGHDLSGAYVTRDGRRDCRQCARVRPRKARDQ